MTTWTAIGANPAPGDPSLLRQIATEFRSIGDRVRATADRLNTISSSLGPHLWSGPGAEAFVHVAVNGLRPVAQEIAAKHADAAIAMTDFANAVEQAQGIAERAEKAGESAMQASDTAGRDRTAAAADAASAVTARNQAKDRIAQAHALEASSVGDPAYVAQLKQYEQEMLRVFYAALSREDQANGREAAARGAIEQAQRDLAAARSQAQEARSSHDDAVRIVVTRLHSDSQQGTSLIEKFEQVITALDNTGKLRDIFAWLTRNANRVGRYPKEWEEILKDFREGGRMNNMLQYKRSPVMKFFSKQQKLHQFLDNKAFKAVTRKIGFISYGIDVLHDGADLRDHLRDGDYLGALADGKDFAASTLKTFGGPVSYLAGYGISVWSDVFTEARKIDWGQPMSANDWVEYGPEAFKDALGDVGKRMILKWS
jgi:hypothetical protein